MRQPRPRAAVPDGPRTDRGAGRVRSTVGAMFAVTIVEGSLVWREHPDPEPGPGRPAGGGARPPASTPPT